MTSNTAQSRRAFRRCSYTAMFALAGFLDIALSCRILADISLRSAVDWGGLGAIAYGLVYLVFSYLSEFFGDDPEGDANAKVLHDEADAETDSLEDEDDGWIAALGWRLLTWAIVAVSFVALFVMFNAKSIFVIAIFTAFAPNTTFVQFLAVVAISGLVQLTVMNTVTIPVARKRQISL